MDAAEGILKGSKLCALAEQVKGKREMVERFHSQLKCEDEQNKTHRTHMQTDCPTNVMRRNVMREKKQSETEAERDLSGVKKLSYLTQGTQNLPNLQGQDTEQRQGERNHETLEGGGRRR